MFAHSPNRTAQRHAAQRAAAQRQAVARALARPRSTYRSTYIVWWAALLLALAALLAFARPAQAQEGCIEAACVSTTGRLASVDAEDSELLNPLLAALLGDESALTLSVADYQALAAAEVTLGDLLEGLRLETGAATPSEVLTGTITLANLATVLDTLLPANPDLLPVIGGFDGTLNLGDLLNLSLAPEALANANLNVLDLLVGSIQLFNSQNAVAVQPITLNGVDLGIATIGDVGLTAKVMSAPEIVCGPEGTQFRSAAIRLALSVDLLGTDVSAISVGLTPLLTAIVDAEVANLDLYVDVASGSGTIQTIDAIAGSVTISATPGIAGLYLGAPAAGADFFAADFDPATDLITGTVGTITGSVLIDQAPLPPTTLATLTGTVGIRAAAEGSSAGQSVDFNGPFSQTQTITTTGSALGTLLATLLGNLTLEVDANLAFVGVPDPPLGGLVEDALEPLLDGLFFDEGDPVGGALNDLLDGLVNPALGLLGVGLGEMELTLFGGGSGGPGDFALCPDLRITVQQSGVYTMGQAATITVTVANVGEIDTSAPITVSAALSPSFFFSSSAGSDAGWVRGPGANPHTFQHPGPLAPGAELLLLLQVSPRRIGPVEGSITGGTPGDESPANNTAPLTGTINPAGGDDQDGDGIPDDVECPNGPPDCPDSDNDGIPDYQDPDSDNDGIPDAVECPNGPPCPDTDDDGIPDFRDPDSDGDGIRDEHECPDGPPCPDSDGDGTPDHLDLDADNDGVPDAIECPTGGPNCRDTDNDGLPNYRDPDDDNDGLLTRPECPNGPPCPDSVDDGEDLEDYLNPDFPFVGGIGEDHYLPVIYHDTNVAPARE